MLLMLLCVHHHRQHDHLCNASYAQTLRWPLDADRCSRLVLQDTDDGLRLLRQQRKHMQLNARACVRMLMCNELRVCDLA